MIKRIIELYQEGKSIRDIEKETNIGRTRISKILKLEGFILPSNIEASRDKRKKRKQKNMLIVGSLYEEGLIAKQISIETGFSLRYVYKLIKKYEEYKNSKENEEGL